MANAFPSGSLVLSLRPGSGLGNRMRALLSAAAIAEHEGREFFYHWPITNSFSARVGELWSSVPGTEIDTPGPEPIVMDTKEDGKWRPASIDDQRDAEVISVSTAYALQGWGGERDWTELLAELPVSKEVRERLVNASHEGDGADGGPFIGVQVRAHPTLTHPLTMEKSPIGWFVQRMRELLDEDERTRFFLSADTRDAEQEIISEVPRVSLIAKAGKYNSRLGLIEAVADLKQLSGTDRILAPYWSSFADLAWYMSRRAMPIETSQGVKGV